MAFQKYTRSESYRVLTEEERQKLLAPSPEARKTLAKLDEKNPSS